MIKCENGIFVEVDDESVIDFDNAEIADNGEADKITALAEKLSTANTIAQIRAAAKSILEETESEE